MSYFNQTTQPKSKEQIEKEGNKNKSSTSPIAEQPKIGTIEKLNLVKKANKDGDGAVYVLGSR